MIHHSHESIHERGLHGVWMVNMPPENHNHKHMTTEWDEACFPKKSKMDGPTYFAFCIPLRCAPCNVSDVGPKSQKGNRPENHLYAAYEIHF